MPDSGQAQTDQKTDLHQVGLSVTKFDIFDISSGLKIIKFSNRLIYNKIEYSILRNWKLFYLDLYAYLLKLKILCRESLN